MKYIANQDIGDFKAGDEVPAEQAEVWNNAYVKPVCDVVKEAPKPEPVKEVAKKSVKKAAKKVAKKKSLFKKK